MSLFQVSVFAVLSAVTVVEAGWLDRVVKFYKQKFFADLQDLAPLHFNATIKPAPPGYVDSQDWDYESVARLLTLLREHKHTKPVFNQVRRMLQPSRRANYNRNFDFIPSLAKNVQPNYFWGFEPPEEKHQISTSTAVTNSYRLDDDAVVYVSNPVESRLPSARISVKLLKSILEHRARVARIMPSTVRTTPVREDREEATEPTNTTKAGPWYKHVPDQHGGKWYINVGTNSDGVDIFKRYHPGKDKKKDANKSKEKKEENKDEKKEEKEDGKEQDDKKDKKEDEKKDEEKEKQDEKKEEKKDENESKKEEGKEEEKKDGNEEEKKEGKEEEKKEEGEEESKKEEEESKKEEGEEEKKEE